MTHTVVAPWGTHHQGQEKMISLTFQKLCSQFLPTVCLLWTKIFFCNCVYPLLEVEDPKWMLLRATISTNHRLSSTDQNWWSYWSLTTTNFWSSRPNSSHFCENRKFSRQYLFSPTPRRAYLVIRFFRKRPHRGKNSNHPGPSQFKKINRPSW